MENSSPTFSYYNFNQYTEQKYLYSTPLYLIFILNRRVNENYYYDGHLNYNTKIDLSSVIIRKDNANIYKLSSVIKEKRYPPTINNKISRNEYNFNYITINTDINGNFYYYEGGKKISKMFKNGEYFGHILIYRH